MKKRRPIRVNGMWSDFLRGFIAASAVLILALAVLLGIHRAQVNTERICFGAEPMNFSFIIAIKGQPVEKC